MCIYIYIYRVRVAYVIYIYDSCVVRRRLQWWRGGDDIVGGGGSTALPAASAHYRHTFRGRWSFLVVVAVPLSQTLVFARVIFFARRPFFVTRNTIFFFLLVRIACIVAVDVYVYVFRLYETLFIFTDHHRRPVVRCSFCHGAKIFRRRLNPATYPKVLHGHIW